MVDLWDPANPHKTAQLLHFDCPLVVTTAGLPGRTEVTWAWETTDPVFCRTERMGSRRGESRAALGGVGK